MENATKALLIAAGIFISILILSLLVMFKEDISSYFSQKHDAKMIEQMQEFNAKFENYNGKEIRGNELVSIMNKIIDYNNLQSEMKGFKRIIINVDLKNHANELAYDGNATLFKNKINNKTNDKAIKKIAEASIKISDDTGLDDLELQKLSSNLHNLLEDPNTDAEIIKAAKEYHQLTYFKRVMFKCTRVSYDVDTGRVSGMTFQAIEEDGKIKLN